MPAPSRALIVAAFVALYVIWGSTYLAIRFAIDTLPPLLMAGSRFFLAGALLYGWMRLVARAPGATARGWRNALVVGAGLVLAGNGGVTLAEQYLPSGVASLLVAMVPLHLALLGWASGMAARPTALAWLGLALGLGGVALLAWQPVASAVPIPGHGGRGVALLFGSTLLWSAGSLYARKHPPAASPLVGVAMQMLCGGTLQLVAGLLLGEAGQVNLAGVSAQSWLAFGYLITFGSIVGFSAYVWLLGVVEPALVGTYAFVNPAVAVLLGWAFAGERLTPPMAGGAALIVLAVALVVLGGRRKPTA